jgi:FkbM family methyltransferase
MESSERSDYGQCVEVLLSAIYHRCVASGDTAIDGGANAGLHTIPLARLVRPSGTVYAYEPQPQPVADLRRWLKSAHLDAYCITRQVALGRTSGAAQFFINKSSAFSSARIMDGHPENWTPHQVHMVRLDEEPIRGRCTFLKLDLEGGEYDALTGAAALIRRHAPIVAFECGFEWAASRYGYDIRDFWRFFADLDYKVHDFEGRMATEGSFSGRTMFWELVAFHKDDARAKVVLDTIAEFNARLSLVAAAKTWPEVIARVEKPFSTGFWSDRGKPP